MTIHPVFGPISTDDPSEEEILSKYIQIYDRPVFSKEIYHAYWNSLMYHVGRETNAICHVQDDPASLVMNKWDLADICEVSPNEYYVFHQELIDRKYLAEIILGGNRYFVMNPSFVMHGDLIPKIVFELFDIKLD